MFLFQEPTLFATSIWENIRYGRPDATDIEVMEAARSANAHEFIANFPKSFLREHSYMTSDVFWEMRLDLCTYLPKNLTSYMNAP